MKKNWLLFLFVLLNTMVAYAQYDNKALTILDAMSNKYKNYTSFKAKFTFTMDNPQAKIKEVSEGDITVKGAKYYLKMGAQEIYNNGATVWTYIKEANEVNITNYEPGEDDVTPTKIYTLYKKGFKYQFLEEKIVGGVAYEYIELNPEDRNKKFFKIKLELNKKDKSIRSWKIYEKNGTTYTYQLKNFVPNVKLDDSFFNFDKAKYAGVSVEDLR